jgi:hypothetical protein
VAFLSKGKAGHQPAHGVKAKTEDSETDHV